MVPRPVALGVELERHLREIVLAIFALSTTHTRALSPFKIQGGRAAACMSITHTVEHECFHIGFPVLFFPRLVLLRREGSKEKRKKHIVFMNITLLAFSQRVMLSSSHNPSSSRPLSPHGHTHSSMSFLSTTTATTGCPTPSPVTPTLPHTLSAPLPLTLYLPPLPPLLTGEYLSPFAFHPESQSRKCRKARSK